MNPLLKVFLTLVLSTTFISATAFASESPLCETSGNSAVDKYLQGLLPEVGATLIAAGFIEDFKARLESQPDLRAQWMAMPDNQEPVLQQLLDSALELREQTRLTILLHLAKTDWIKAFELTCEDHLHYAVRMSQRDAQAYFSLERTTMKAALDMGVQGIPVWLNLPDESARKNALIQAERTAKGMPAYPFSFEGRTRFSALAVLGLTKGSADIRLQPWMQEVRRVLGKGNSYLKSIEATHLRKGVTSIVDTLVANTFQGQERDKLHETYDQQMAKVLAAL